MPVGPIHHRRDCKTMRQSREIGHRFVPAIARHRAPRALAIDARACADRGLLDQMIAVVTASTVVAYAFYTVSPEVREKLHTDSLYLTVPFVLFGIFRYLYLIHQRAEGGNPTQLLVSDRPLCINVVLWIATAVWLLYG